jgi:hypothetical protein
VSESLLNRPMLTEAWLDKADWKLFKAPAAPHGFLKELESDDPKSRSSVEDLYRNRAIAGLIKDSYLNDNETLAKFWHHLSRWRRRARSRGLDIDVA